MATNLLVHARKKWRARGYHVEGTESINRLPNGNVRRNDLHGFADLVCINEEEIVYLQVTSWSNVSARRRKIENETVGKGQWAIRIAAIARMLLGFGHTRIVIEGWKLDPKAYRYVNKEIEVTLESLPVPD